MDDHKKGFGHLVPGYNASSMATRKIIIRKRFFYISFGSGIFRTFQDAVFSMGGKVNEGNFCLRRQEFPHLYTIHRSLQFNVQDDKVRLFFLDQGNGINAIFC